MDSIIQKWTEMLTEASQGGLTILMVGAVVAIIIVVLSGIFSGNNDQNRASAVKTIIVILVFCAVATCATNLVQWAIA